MSVIVCVDMLVTSVQEKYTPTAFCWFANCRTALYKVPRFRQQVRHYKINMPLIKSALTPKSSIHILWLLRFRPFVRFYYCITYTYYTIILVAVQLYLCSCIALRFPIYKKMNNNALHNRIFYINDLEK